MSTVPSPAVAAVLSLVFPGLGQVYAGARQRGMLLAVPWVLLLIGVLVVVAGGTDTLLPIFFSAQMRTALLVLLVAIFFYHAATVLDAYNVALRERRASGVHTANGSVVIVAVLVAIMLVPYGVLEVYGIQASTTMSGLFRGDNEQPDDFIPPFEQESQEPAAPATPVAPSPTPTTDASGIPAPASPTPAGPSPSPTPVPPVYGPIDAAWAENGRLDLLLVGADTGAGRSSTRTDTMILLSVEIETGRAAMFGFPRNMTNVPLGEAQTAYPGNVLPAPEFLSGLWRRAAERPGQFPGSDGIGRECQFDFACARGWRALAGSIQQMAGVPLDGIIAVDLNGFADLVDAVGGVWIDVPSRVVDPRYPTQDGTRIAIDIQPGCRKLDGTLALAYARSRRQDSDYQRMRRQQVVLQAIRRQFDPLALLPRVPELLNIARDNLFTTIDEDDIPLMAQVAQRVDSDQMQQGRFVRLRNVTPEGLVEIRQRVRDVFSDPWVEPSPTPDEPGERCPPR